jgi:hypothetical protein
VPDSAQVGDCVQKLLDEFKNYDKTVDLVSCWQFLFTEVQSLAKNVLHFDRFPRLSSPSVAGDQPKTPDFAVLFSDSYGIVADVKRSFPLDDKEFLSHAKRLLKYDRTLAFKSGIESAPIVPTDHDILLLIPLRDAQEIVHRIGAFRREGKLAVERNLISVEWVWDSDRNEYIFRKIAGQDADFRDSSLPADSRLSSILTQHGTSLKVSPEKIKSIKAAWQFCNDTPPPIYTLVFLWTKILYHFLDSNQRQQWRRRDPRKAMWIQVSVQNLVKEIERRYPVRRGHWTDWVRSALDALELTGLAKKHGDGEYEVGFRNLVRELGEPGHDASGVKTPFHTQDYARILATYICSGAGGVKAQKIENPADSSQGKLFQP